MNTDLIWTLVAMIGILLSLPGTVELLVLTVAALFPVRASVRAGGVADLKIAVLVPVHNEESGILTCIARLKECIGNDDKVSLVVVADNCTDLTVDRALAAGVRVVVWSNSEKQGRAYALDYAFRSLLLEPFDGMLVVNADTRVEGSLIPEFRRALAEGADAVQCSYLLSSPANSIKARFTQITWLAFNHLRLRARKKLGCSVGLLGNGYAISRDTLQAVPYHSGSVADDLNYHLRLVRSGRSVRYTASTTIWRANLESGKSEPRCWTGWGTGRWRTIVDQVPSLIEEICRGRYALVEPLGELLLLPLAIHTLLLMAALAIPVSGAKIYAVLGFTVMLFHLLATIKLGKGGWREVGIVCLLPFYFVWKFLMDQWVARIWRKNNNRIHPKSA